jgi:hypothetical protein
MSDIGSLNNTFSALLLFGLVPVALLGAGVSWWLARRVSSNAEFRVWCGVWAALPELTMTSVAWLEFQRPVATLVVAGVLLVGAIQCARAELRWLRGGSRQTRWRLAPHALVPVSVVVFAAMGFFERVEIAVSAAIASGLVAVWGTWPMRPIRSLNG